MIVYITFNFINIGTVDETEPRDENPKGNRLKERRFCRKKFFSHSIAYWLYFRWGDTNSCLQLLLRSRDIPGFNYFYKYYYVRVVFRTVWSISCFCLCVCLCVCLFQLVLLIGLVVSINSLFRYLNARQRTIPTASFPGCVDLWNFLPADYFLLPINLIFTRLKSIGIFCFW